jgi:multidrug resistance efflux pump
VDRYAPLAREKAITDQELDNATQANLAAKAQVKAAGAGVETAKAAIVAAKAGVEAAKAGVQTAELNLSFTRITSLIDGIAGIAQTQVGNLVSPTSGTLTTVSTRLR